MNGSTFFIGTSLGDNPVPDHFVALSRELAERGGQVVILAPHRRTDLENAGGNPAILTWPSPRPTRLRDAVFFRTLTAKSRPACLIANFAAVNIMLAVGRSASVPVRVAWYHTLTEQLREDGGGRAKHLLQRWRKRWVYRCATHLVANSAAGAADLRLAYGIRPDKCQVFHNALADPVPRLGLRACPRKRDHLLCVGRLFRSKGHDVVLRALTILRTHMPALQVEFVGDGPARAELEQLAWRLGVRDQCSFAGVIPHDQVLKKMAGAAATLVPSRSEAFGMVNIESMSVGTPVIASRVGGIVEILRDGIDGLLVEPGDPVSLAQRIELIVTDRDLQGRLGAAARQRFLCHLEQRRAVVAQVDWLEHLVRSAQHSL